MKNSQNSKAVQLRQAIAALKERMTPSPAERSNGVDVQRQLQQNAAFKAQMLQRRAAGDADTGAVLEAAAVGVQGSGGALPHLDAIQKSFGRHNVSRVQAFVGGQAKAASEAIGAEAYATGSRIAFRESPTLHTAAHEAAHVVQQRVGVSLSGGVGQVGDRYERHADEVADRVVQGKSAEDLLDAFAGGGRQTTVQLKDEADPERQAVRAAAAKANIHLRLIINLLSRHADKNATIAKGTTALRAVAGRLSLVAQGNAKLLGKLGRLAGFVITVDRLLTAGNGGDMLAAIFDFGVHIVMGMNPPLMALDALLSAIATPAWPSVLLGRLSNVSFEAYFEAWRRHQEGTGEPLIPPGAKKL